MKRSLTSLLLCIAAQASTVPSVGLEELIDRSEAIVHGRVVRSWSTWDGARKYIWTHHLIAVIDAVRGGSGGHVVASEPGGRLGSVGMRFSGALDYAPGEEAILFLHRTPIGFLRAVAHGQGKYTVTSGTRVRANLNSGRTELATLNNLPAADFKARVREAIRRRK